MSSPSTPNTAPDYPVIDLEHCWKVTQEDVRVGWAQTDGFGELLMSFNDQVSDVVTIEDAVLTEPDPDALMAGFLSYGFTGNQEFSKHLTSLEEYMAFLGNGNEEPLTTARSLHQALLNERFARLQKQVDIVNEHIRGSEFAMKVIFRAGEPRDERDSYVATLHSVYIGSEQPADEWTDDEARHFLKLGVVVIGKQEQIGRLPDNAGGYTLGYQIPA